MIHAIVLIVGLIAVVPMLLYTAVVGLWLVLIAVEALILEPLYAFREWRRDRERWRARH